MRELWRGLFLTNRFFALGSIAVFAFALSFAWPPLFYLGQTLWWGTFLAVLVAVFRLFRRMPSLQVTRQLPEAISLGDENTVRLRLRSPSTKTLAVEVIDELPYQLQERNFSFALRLAPDDETEAHYPFRPLSRGVYAFGKVHVFLADPWKLIWRRFSFPLAQEVAVYPSVQQMKKYELIASSKLANSYGVRKLRRIGHSYEFEQIKNYVQGDDYRSINWKATGRRNQLMVNQYQDERSQQVYLLLDKSRTMRMPFNGLSLLDYAINAALVIANLSLRKQDKAGLITFSDKLGQHVQASRRSGQLRRVLEALYRQKTNFPEANYELVYQTVRRQISGRSLLLLFTNFESEGALERVLPVLRRLNKLHLLVVVLFENTEIREFVGTPVEEIETIYTQTIAHRMLIEKKKLAFRLSQYGIQNVLTTPEDLSMQTVNKYLELKSRGLI